MSEPICPRCARNVSEHPANRCLDAWVAEAVMDWTVHPVGGATEFPDTDGRTVYMSECPQFSTGIADAWMVVEKMRELGRSLLLENECAVDCVLARFEMAPEMDNDLGAHDARADAPLAICRAAIKAVGGTDGR